MSDQNEQAAERATVPFTDNLDRMLRGPRRERTWDELSSDEKIERLREQLRTREMAIQDLREGLARLMSHQHGPNGELLGPIGYAGGYPMELAGRRYDPLA